MAPIVGIPGLVEEEVSVQEWVLNCGLAIFLEALGASAQVVPVEADGYCGFRCVSKLMGMSVHDLFGLRKRKFCKDERLHKLALLGWQGHDALQAADPLGQTTFLTQTELCRLLEKLVGQPAPPLVEVNLEIATENTNLLESCFLADHTIPSGSGDPLYQSGFRQVTAEVVNARCSWEALAATRPLVVQVGIHFFPVGPLTCCPDLQDADAEVFKEFASGAEESPTTCASRPVARPKAAASDSLFAHSQDGLLKEDDEKA